MSAIWCDNCGAGGATVLVYRRCTSDAEMVCCEMPNPNDINPVGVLDAAIDRCGFPPRFSWMTQDQLLAYQTLRNAQNYLLDNGLAVYAAPRGWDAVEGGAR